MPFTLTLTVPAAATEALCQQLLALPAVISLRVQLGGSRKPPGDVLTLDVLDGSSAEVQRLLDAAPLLHQHSSAPAPLAMLPRLTLPYLLLMLLGGSVATLGLVAEPAPQAVAFVAAGFMAPAFEPLACLAQALGTGRWPLAARYLGTALAGYAALVAAAFLSMHLLLATQGSNVVELVTNPAVAGLRFPGAKELGLAGAGAVAGVLLLAMGQRRALAGPLIALGLLPATALLGSALAVGRSTLAGAGLLRVLADAGLIIGAGLLGAGFRRVRQRRAGQ